MGCGLIAASDIELYLTQQNEGYKASLSPVNDIVFDADTAEIAKDKDESGSEDCTAHYMTIIGLYKYWDEASSEYDYILQATSWGEVFYIRFDEYSDNISYFSNIFRIK